jgi:hypothetical protein
MVLWWGEAPELHRLHRRAIDVSGLSVCEANQPADLSDVAYEKSVALS